MGLVKHKLHQGATSGWRRRKAPTLESTVLYVTIYTHKFSLLAATLRDHIWSYNYDYIDALGIKKFRIKTKTEQ